MKEGEGVVLAGIALLALVVLVLALRKPPAVQKTFAESLFGNAPDIISAVGLL